MLKRLLTLSASAILLTSLILGYGCGGDDGTTPDNGDDKSKWTILVYMDGNNNLDYADNGDSYVISDIQEMQEVGSVPGDVEVIALYAALKTGGNAKIYYVEEYPNDFGDNISSTELEDWGTVDMSDPATLTNFIEYGAENYPADNYMLIIDDHGAGWPGHCTDEQNGAGDLMSMIDTREALEDVEAGKAGDPIHFDVITFHCCLMASVECPYELRNNADWYVSCQFVMPMESVFGADIWLEQLVDEPSMDPEDLAKNICRAVYERGEDNQKMVHFSAVDLSKIAAVADKVNELESVLVSEVGGGNLWAEVSHAWGETHFTDYDDLHCVDLREFGRKIQLEPNLSQINLINNAAEDLEDAITDAVVYTTTNVPTLSRCGFNIWMPFDANVFNASVQDYRDLAFDDSNWSNFLVEFINNLGGGNPTGTVAVNSNPAGAAIVIGGENTGEVTNVVFENVEVGNYQVTLTLAGYQDYTETVTVTEGQTTTINATLQLAGGGTGSLLVNSTPTGAAIFANGVDQGVVTNGTVNNMPVGTYTVGLTLNGYQDWTNNAVVITANQTTTVNATLQPAGGNNAVVTGNVAWFDGRARTNVTVWIENLAGDVWFTQATPDAQGNFTMTATAAIDDGWPIAVDDLDQSGVAPNAYRTAGDGFGFYDGNQDGQWNDIIDVGLGETVTINMTMFVYDPGKHGLPERVKVRTP